MVLVAWAAYQTLDPDDSRDLAFLIVAQSGNRPCAKIHRLLLLNAKAKGDCIEME